MFDNMFDKLENSLESMIDRVITKALEKFAEVNKQHYEVVTNKDNMLHRMYGPIPRKGELVTIRFIDRNYKHTTYTGIVTEISYESDGEYRTDITVTITV